MSSFGTRGSGRATPSRIGDVLRTLTANAGHAMPTKVNTGRPALLLTLLTVTVPLLTVASPDPSHNKGTPVKPGVAPHGSSPPRRLPTPRRTRPPRPQCRSARGSSEALVTGWRA